MGVAVRAGHALQMPLCGAYGEAFMREHLDYAPVFGECDNCGLFSVVRADQERCSLASVIALA